jgi:hypothetical protein
VKLVHLVGFIIKKFVTMQGHMNVKSNSHCNLSNPHCPIGYLILVLPVVMF